uniref:Uncharacterized protein n=1 Tax=Lotharella oceanica TaxID=641309 RepID=A0A7S2X7T2_9EUKA|mmetsp:Transcript_14328/g.27238  ORF Transcript_14328/g.27238 Transcript_14328/m.27238 type:complete len:161 (+) Transcript_14328:225-707(+)
MLSSPHGLTASQTFTISSKELVTRIPNQEPESEPVAIVSPGLYLELWRFRVRKKLNIRVSDTRHDDMPSFGTRSNNKREITSMHLTRSITSKVEAENKNRKNKRLREENQREDSQLETSPGLSRHIKKHALSHPADEIISEASDFAISDQSDPSISKFLR